MTNAFDLVDAQLRSWVEERDFSGIAAVRRGGIVEFEGCYGLANRSDSAPITPRTRFALASVSKMFTAAAVATLVRDGRVAFDTPVVSVLPADRRPATLQPDVTVHHLLTHTSGIADYAEEEDEDFDYGALWADRPVAGMLRPADFLPLFGDLEPYRPPGGPWQYSNAGFIVLALIVEELAGQPFAEAVGERVLGPAGMTASGYFRSDEARPDIAVGYLERASRDEPWRTNAHAIPVVGGGDGGAYSTAADLDRFLRAYDDGSLFGTALRDEMLTARATVGPRAEYGYGVYLSGGCFGHAGGDPGVAAIAQRLPAADLSVAVLCNVEAPVVAVHNQLLAAATGA
ncbi:serine hydrolase domain-containing protein [Jatrophihabitans sp.]|jgi:CubicO group peptidase (beta-lactamase class C family)|uniref:serine hydrolase domain-containing protein n=1 Tax=Jatrophihabitans sp. TaxID=1932789 RepID=UPI002EF9674A